MPCHDTKDNAAFYRFIPPLYPILEQSQFDNPASQNIFARSTKYSRRYRSEFYETPNLSPTYLEVLLANEQTSGQVVRGMNNFVKPSFPSKFILYINLQLKEEKRYNYKHPDTFALKERLFC